MMRRAVVALPLLIAACASVQTIEHAAIEYVALPYCPTQDSVVIAAYREKSPGLSDLLLPGLVPADPWVLTSLLTAR